MPIDVEFSRIVTVDSLPPGDVARSVQATAAECAALARRFDLIALGSLAADLELRRDGAVVQVRGRVRAAVTQRCVVTLEPVDGTVDAEFERLFSQDVPETQDDEVEIPADVELPEPLVGDRLDLGEIVAEELSLALDPYPRSPAADARMAELGEGEDGAAHGPFAALRTRRPN